jgi:hypothetical protein
MSDPAIRSLGVTWCTRFGCSWSGRHDDYAAHLATAHPASTFGARPAAETTPPLAEPTSLTLDEQIHIIVDHLIGKGEHTTAAAFLAGTRFAGGYDVYGDELFTKTRSELYRDTLEEHADAWVYTTRIGMLDA